MNRIAENVKDGSMKSEFNQQDWMNDLLEDRNKTRKGLYSSWNHRTATFRRNYDNINWENDNG